MFMIPKSLTNLQLEILKLYSTNLSEDELKELKRLLAENYAKKAIKEANDVYTSNGLTDSDMESWLNEN